MATLSPLDFFATLRWLDGRPLLDVIEPYRRRIFEDALYTFEADGTPRYNQALCGRAKKNWKSADLILAALYRLFVWPVTEAGNDGFILANDEAQAADDLDIAKKLLRANPILAREARATAKAIERYDGRGTLKILPARDVAGAHGKTYNFVGYDEIHAYRSWDLFEALAPDPSRRDALVWITSYASIYQSPDLPLNALLREARKGSDPRMFFSWYSGEFTTDPALADAEPEARANPSMASWGNPEYLAQQRRRLPTHRYRRLHLNLPGAPDGAFLDPDRVLACIVPGRGALPPQKGIRYAAFVDMSGGSSDDATLAIGHEADGRVIVDRVEKQSARAAPFDPRAAVTKFARLCREYRVSRVEGDRYAGQTFRADFEREGIAYEPCGVPKTALYEDLEPKVNAGEVELPDLPILQEQLLTLVQRGARIDHAAGEHDDFANAVAGLARRLTGATPLAWALGPGLDSAGPESGPSEVERICREQGAYFPPDLGREPGGLGGW